MPETYRSQHAGTIADLIGRRGSSAANLARAQGDIEAQRAMATGQAWGGAIQNIGQAVGGTLADFAQYKRDEPNRVLRQRQSEQLAKELSAMDAASAASQIGKLAEMVKASGYDPGTAEPIFRAIGKLSPDYEQPLLRSLMEPAMLKTVTDTLITQVPSYKAPSAVTLSEGAQMRSPTGELLAENPKAPPVAQPYTLTPGSERRGPNNEVVASVPANPPVVNLQADDVLLDGKRAKAVFNPRTGRYTRNGEDVTDRVEPIPPQPSGGSGQPRPLTQTAEAQIIQRLNTQWGAAQKPIKELERQVALMDTGMEAVKRGDMAQGAQMVLVTFQKILDPPSVVRESEFMRSAAGQSLMNRVKGAAERLTQGGAGVTTPELQKFATLAREAASAQRTAANLDGVKKRIGGIADRYNIPGELIFEETGMGGAAPAVAPAAVEEWDFDAKGNLVKKVKKP